MGENIDLIIAKAARQEIIDTIKDIEALDASFIEFAGHVAQFSKTKIAPKLPKEFNAEIAKSVEIETKLAKLRKEEENAIAAKNRALNTALAVEKSKQSIENTSLTIQAKKNKLIKEEEKANNNLSKSSRVNLTSQRALNSVLAQYSRYLNVVKQNKKDLELKQELGIKLTNKEVASLKRLTSEFNKYDSAIRKVNEKNGDFQQSVGRYPRIMQGATAALTRFGAALGIYSGYQIAEKIFNEVKQLESLNLALSAVTKTQDEFNQSESYLNELAEFSGINIVTLTESYIKFRGSIEGSNTSIKDAQRIYERITKASAILGASTDDVNGVLRALGQIMSKGKIQAEELRGQLGDRLAGAFGLMAKSIGVSTAELDKMLEKGELTSDMLSGLAEEVGNAFGVDNLEKIENITAAQGRLSTSWTNFVKTVNGSENVLGKVFQNILNTMAKALTQFGEFTKSAATKDSEKQLGIRTEAYNAEVQKMELTSKHLGKSMKEQADDNFFEYTKAVEAASEELAKLKKAHSEVNQTIGKGSKSHTGAQGVSRRRSDDLEVQIANATSQLSVKLGKLDAVRAKMVINTEAQKETTEEIEDSGNAVDKLRDKLENVKSAKFSYGIYQDERKGAFDDVKAEDGSLFDLGNIEAPDTSEIEAALNRIVQKYQEVANASKISAEDQADAFGQLFSTFADYYNIDLDAFKAVLFDKTAGVEQYADALKSVSQFILGNTIEKYDAEIQANRDKLEALQDDENISDDVKKDAEKKNKEEEKRLRIKQAKAERAAILTQIAIDTAAAIIKVTAQTGILSPFIIPGIIALGVAQAGFVASRPLPQYAEGTQNAEGGKAITDEEGAELHTDRYGNIKDWGSNKGARIKNTAKGDRIYTASQTEAIHKAIFLSNMEAQGSSNNIEAIFNKNLGKMRGEVADGVKDGLKGFKINNTIINQVNKTRTRF